MAGYLYYRGLKNCPPRLITSSPFRVKTIVSYGLMIQALDTQKWLIVQRKHTIEFILLLQGNYRYSYLPTLIANLTINEQQEMRKILDLDYPDFCRYCQDLGLDDRNYLLGFENLSAHIFSLEMLLKNVTKSGELKWSWPKGRCEWKEKPFACACREFVEEIEVELPPAVWVDPSVHIFRQNTILGREIEGRFWHYQIEKEFPLPLPTNNEVAMTKWVSFSDLVRYLGYDPIPEIRKQPF